MAGYSKDKNWNYTIYSWWDSYKVNSNWTVTNSSWVTWTFSWNTFVPSSWWGGGGWWWGGWWWWGWSSSSNNKWTNQTYYKDDGSSVFIWDTWVVRFTDKNWKTTETKITWSEAAKMASMMWQNWYTTRWWGTSWWFSNNTTPDFGNLKFWQGTSDTDQAARNKELAGYYGNMWNVTADQIRNDLMKNAWFASASAQDQANTVDRILRMANANISSGWWINFWWLQFWQWTSDEDQKTRNEQLANYYAGQWDYSRESIMADLMKNPAFANASKEDRENTVNRILNAANWISGWTNWMKFWSDAYADTNYDIDSRNQTLANIINEREYDTADKVYDWLENSSEAFRDASQADKDNTVKKLMALSKYWVDSLNTEPDDETIEEENKDEDEDEDITEEDIYNDPYLQQLLDQIDSLQRQIDRLSDPYQDYYNKNPNEDTLNWSWDLEKQEESKPLSMNSLSLAANLENNWTGAPEFVDPNLSTATPYLTPWSNIKQDVNNAWDQAVVTEAWLVNNPTVPKFSVYNIDTPDGIIQAWTDALTNIMNWQYGWNQTQEAFQTYLLVQNRLRNYAAQNGIKEWTPEYMNLFRWVLDHPIRKNLPNNPQSQWIDQQTE